MIWHEWLAWALVVLLVMWLVGESRERARWMRTALTMADDPR